MDRINRLEQKLDNNLIIFCMLVAMTLAVYCNSFTVPFILDDFGSISNNYAIRNPLDIASIWKFYSNRFVLYFTISLNFFVHDTAVIGYHIVNTLIHIYNGILVFSIIRLILGFSCSAGHIAAKYKNIVSILAALIFLCHPVQVNAVTYIIQRTASLAALFYLSAVYSFLKFRTTDKIRYFMMTLAFTVVAMFTKENTVTIPFMLVLLEILFFLRDGRTSWTKRIAFFFVLFLTVPIIPGTNLLLKGYSQSDPDVTFKASTSMNRFHYLYTQFNVILEYIKQIFVPYNLNFDYSNDFPLSKTIWENRSYLSLVVHFVILLFGFLNIRKNKLIALGILWFYIGLSVESSLISIKDVYFEHRLYFPMAGFVIFLIGVIFAVRGNTEKRRSILKHPLPVYLVLSLSMIIGYSAVTLHRNYIFKDGIRLWSDVIKKSPGSDRAHSVLGTNYLDAYEADKERKEHLELAEIELKKSIELRYNNSTSHCNLSKVYLLQDKYEKSIDEARITNNISKSEYAYHNMGLAYKKMGKTQEAIDAFLEGYKLDNKCSFILKALGNTYYEMEDYKNAEKYFEEFLKHNIYSDSKEIQEKLDELRKSLDDEAHEKPDFLPESG